MPLFLDSHPLKPLNGSRLRRIQGEPTDEFGVKHVNFFYNVQEDKVFCLLEAPSKQAVKKHHEKAGVESDWIIEVENTASPRSLKTHQSVDLY